MINRNPLTPNPTLTLAIIIGTVLVTVWLVIMAADHTTPLSEKFVRPTETCIRNNPPPWGDGQRVCYPQQ